MHGMINRALEGFARDTYGDALWFSVLEEVELAPDAFDAAFLSYAALTDRVLDALSRALRKEPEEVLEDLGTFLVASPKMNSVRRLLRFSGEDFEEFLYSLNELPARARMALPDLDLPALDLAEGVGGGLLCLRVHGTNRMRRGYGHVMLGLLRAMADDYGALIVLDHCITRDGVEEIGIQLLETEFAKARDFALGEQGSCRCGCPTISRGSRRSSMSSAPCICCLIPRTASCAPDARLKRSAQRRAFSLVALFSRC